MTFHKNFPSPERRITLLHNLHSEEDINSGVTFDDFSSYFYLRNANNPLFIEEIKYLENYLSEEVFPEKYLMGLKFNKLNLYFWKSRQLQNDFDIENKAEDRLSFQTFLFRNWRNHYHPLPQEFILINSISEITIEDSKSSLTKLQEYALREALGENKQISKKYAIGLLAFYFTFVTDASIKLFVEEFKNLTLLIKSLNTEEVLAEQTINELSFLKKIVAENAPEPKKQPAQPQKVTNGSIQIIGYPFSPSGLGEDARTTLDSVKKSFKVDLLNLGSQNELDEYKPYEKFLSDYSNINPETRIFNSPPNIGAIVYEKFGKEFFKDSYNIGYCPWELDIWKESLKDCFHFFDEIWAPSKFLYDCYSNLNLNIPVKHIPLAVNIPKFKKYTRKHFNLPEHTFLFYFCFDFNSSFYRKNPQAIYDAFCKAFPVHDGNTGLVFKFSNLKKSDKQHQDFLEKIKSHESIYTIETILSQDEIYSLYTCTDCFVSLHRSEGFGRCIAEALLLMTPVICTNYSGNLDFCSNQNCTLIDGKLTTNQISNYIYSDPKSNWLSVSVDDAANSFIESYNNRFLRSSPSDQMQASLERQLSLDRLLGQIQKELNSF